MHELGPSCLRTDPTAHGPCLGPYPRHEARWWHDTMTRCGTMHAQHGTAHCVAGSGRQGPMAIYMKSSLFESMQFACGGGGGLCPLSPPCTRPYLQSRSLHIWLSYSQDELIDVGVMTSISFPPPFHEAHHFTYLCRKTKKALPKLSSLNVNGAADKGGEISVHPHPKLCHTRM